MKLLKENWFIFVVVLFLLGAIGKWPYIYYQIMRWVVFGVGAYSAYIVYESGRTVWAWILSIIAILFNPIVPFYMQREIWQVLDVVAAFLFLSYFFFKKKE